MGQPIDHFCAPTLFGLPRQNVAADLPVQPHQFPIDRQRRPLLCAVDAPLELGQPVGVALRSGNQGAGFVGHWRSFFCVIRGAA